MFPFSRARLRQHDVAICYINNRAHVAAWTANGIAEACIPNDPEELRRLLQEWKPRSRRTLLAFSHGDLITKALPAPPGLGNAYETWAKSVTSDILGDRQAQHGYWIFSERDRPMALVFAVEKQQIEEQLALARAAKLKIFACLPTLVLGTGTALAAPGDAPHDKNTDSARRVLVVDLLDPQAVTFSAVHDTKTLVVRALPRDAVPTTIQILEEARRTISYVRERHRGLTLDELFLCGEDTNLRDALEMEGLRAVRRAPLSIGEAMLSPISRDYLLQKGNRFDLLPYEQRNRSARKSAFVTLSLAAAVSIFSIVQGAAATRDLEQSLQDDDAVYRGSEDQRDGLIHKLTNLRELRARVKSLESILNNARGTARAACVSRLVELLKNTPESLQINAFESDGNSVVLSGFTIIKRDQPRAEIETFAVDAARRLRADYPRISLVNAKQDGAPELADLYPSGEWTLAEFSIQFRWSKS